MPTEDARWRTALGLVLRLGVAAVLLYAGLSKALDPHGFVEQVANYQWWPESAQLVAVVLPPTEIVAGAALLVPSKPWQQAAALLAAGMFGVFTVAVARAYSLGIDIDCGCFGESSGEIGPLTIVRNVSLTALALGLVWLSRPVRTVDELRAET